MKEEICSPLDLDIFCGMTPARQKQFEFANIQDMSPLYVMVHLIGPALVGAGDPTIKAIVDGFKTKFETINRHSEFITLIASLHIVLIIFSVRHVVV